jgi:hypothetical protein
VIRKEQDLMIRSVLRPVIAALLCFFSFSFAAFGQAGADTSKGTLAVEVQDPTGAVVPGASVVIAGPLGEQRYTSDERGQVLLRAIPPGMYSVRVEQQGFATKIVQNVGVTAAQRATAIVQLETGQLTEVVEVTADSITVDTTSTTVGQTFSEATYVNLPIGRNVASLFTLAPGAAPAGDPVLGVNPSISGASGLENQYIIDGINTTDQGYGSFGVFSNVYGALGSGVNFDFVQEVQVKTGGFEAQYGQALGGVVNVVTRSGSNELHGAAYTYWSPSWGEAEYRQVNPFRTADPLTEIHGRKAFDVGFNLGGPLIKNRVFWYGGFNPTWNTTSRLAPPNFGARDFGVQDWDRRSLNWVGKLNFNITDKHRLEATGFGDPSKDSSGVHRSLVRDDLDNASEATYGTRNVGLKYNGVWTNTTLFNATVAWNYSNFEETPTTDLYQFRNYAKPKPNAVYTNEGGIGFLENNESNNYQYNAMLTKSAQVLGGHTIDIGYGYNDVRYDAFRLYSGPSWALPAADGIDPADVGKGVYGGFFYLYPTRTVGGVEYTNAYRQVRGNFSDPAVETTTDYHSAFAQDAWQINRFITAKLGVRWEQQKLFGNLNSYTFAANWAPRLGFIIDPTGSRKTKLFANWGRFFEKIPQDLAVRAMSEEFGYNNLYFLGLPPTQGNLIPESVASPVGTHPTIIAGGTKAMYQTEIVAGAERELPGNMVVSARFVHRNLSRPLEDVSGISVEQALAGSPQQYVITNPSADLDIFVNPVNCTDGPNCDPDTGFTFDSGQLGSDGLADTFPDARRVYKALELTAEKRFGNSWSLLANYRLAKLFGNYEGLFRNDNGQSDPNITSLFDFVYSPALGDQFKVGELPTDRRHIANVYANYVFKGISLGAGYRMLTGRPLNKLLAHPAYANSGEIPVGGRGAFGRTDTQNFVDARVGYDIPFGETTKLRLAADMFNLFNSKTVIDIDEDFELDGAVPNADFGQPLRTHRPFYARFSVRLEF